MKNSVLEKLKSKQVLPIMIPETRGRSLKNEVLSIRMNDKMLEYFEAELAKLGVLSARERQDFYRGAIFAGLTNARRAKSSNWKDFITAVQPLAQKYLGMGLELDGPKEFLEAGKII